MSDAAIDLAGDLVYLTLYGGTFVFALGSAAKQMPLSPRYPYRLAFNVLLAVIAAHLVLTYDERASA